MNGLMKAAVAIGGLLALTACSGTGLGGELTNQIFVPAGVSNTATTTPKTVSLSAYQPINQGLKNRAELVWIGVGMAYQNNPNQFSDEELLSTHSQSYKNANDAFDKQAIKQTELPRIKAMLKKYATFTKVIVPICNSRISEECGHNAQDRRDFPIIADLPNDGVSSYDFTNQGFKFPSYGNRKCWDNVLLDGVYNDGGINFYSGTNLELQSKLPCFVKVPDEQVARAIEKARSQDALYVRGNAYVNVTEKEGRLTGGALTGDIVRVDLTFYNRNDGQSLGSFVVQ